MLRGLITYSLVTSLAHHVLSAGGTSTPSRSTLVASTLEGATATTYPASSAAVTFSASDPGTAATTSLDPAPATESTSVASSPSEEDTSTTTWSVFMTEEPSTTTVQVCEVPGNVTGLIVTALSYGFKVEWTNLSDSSCIEYYSVCWGDDECGTTTTNEFMIVNLTACTQYIISVSVIGITGNSTAETKQEITLDAVPGSVTSVTVTALSFGLKVEWTEPSENSHCVNNYSVCWGKDECNITTDHELTIDNLSACTQYNISVTAIGSAGNSTPATKPESTLDAVPGSVAGVTVTALSFGLEVEWAEPSENSHCVKNYSVCWWKDECNITTDRELTIDNLSACKQYNISVTAIGSAGNSTPATKQESTLDAVPGSVMGVTVTALSFGLEVEWTEPSENSHCVNNYSVCWGKDECNITTDHELTIDNLSACKQYNISVTAIGSAGNSTPATKQESTLDAVPGSVAGVTVTALSFGLEVEWTEPSENIHCVNNYSVCWGKDKCNITTDHELTIDNLSACKQYNISVTAIGSAGNSTPATKQESTLDAVPGSVAGVTVTALSFGLEVEWTEPSENIHCVNNYSVCWGKDECNITMDHELTIDNLSACTQYNISVTAVGSAGNSTPATKQESTLDAVPGSVLNLDVQPNHTSLEAVWRKPFVNTACTRRYKICWQTVASHYGSSSSSDNCTDTEDEQLRIDNLLPCTEYRLVVAAVGPSQSSGNETMKLKTLPLVPGSITNIKVIDVDTSWLQFTWDEPVKNPTCVLNYTVCWEDATTASSEQCSHSRATNYTVHGLQPCSTYSIAVTAEGSEGSSSAVIQLSQTHEAAPGPPQNLSCAQVGAHNATVEWKASAENAQCVQRYNLSWTGNASSTRDTSYTIVSLQPESRYNVSLAAVTLGDLASTRIYIVIETASEPQNSSVVVAATVISVLLIGGITVCTIYMYRKGILIWPPWEKSALRRKSVTHREIPVKEFRSYCDQLLSTPARLQSEYQLLVTLSADVSATMTTTAGHLPDNKKKNRYVNVIPFDATRVKLETDNKGMSDYINASFIKGYGGGVEYIAAQGPKEETCEDFWNMLLQQNVQLVVMLTQFEENDKVKCFRYFPGLRGNVKFGDITVHCATEMMFPIYTQRTFTIYKDGRKKTVKHLHFREWPDFGCPDSTDVMLEFVQVGRQNTENKDCPTVVHCSAGVGRTGTYIAVDILLQHIRENKKVDIFNTIYKLRQHRVNMVQSEAQYIYIYQCIKDALDDEAIVNAEKSSSSHSLEPIYENIGLALNHPSYEKLAKVRSSCSDSESEL